MAMANKCSICTHKRRAEIDIVLAKGESNRSIAKRFTVGHVAVQRHRDHIRGAIQKAEERAVVKAINIGQRIVEVHAEALDVIQSTLLHAPTTEDRQQGFDELHRTSAFFKADQQSGMGTEPEFQRFIKEPETREKYPELENDYVAWLRRISQTP
jgi:hypothetical protein